MPKKLSEDLAARIEAEIARHEDGIGIDDLHKVLADIVSRRTLQRRVGELSDQRRIAQIGKGRGLRYRQPRIIEVTITEQAHATDKVTTEIRIPVSPEGEEIRRYVRQPRQQRDPVGYKQSLSLIHI